MVSRQQTRRAEFHAAFPAMPLWETWQDEVAAPTPTDPEATELVTNFRGIGRAVRRDMARKFVAKQWKEEHGSSCN